MSRRLCTSRSRRVAVVHAVSEPCELGFQCRVLCPQRVVLESLLVRSVQAQLRGRVRWATGLGLGLGLQLRLPLRLRLQLQLRLRHRLRQLRRGRGREHRLQRWSRVRWRQRFGQRRSPWRRCCISPSRHRCRDNPPPSHRCCSSRGAGSCDGDQRHPHRARLSLRSFARSRRRRCAWPRLRRSEHCAAPRAPPAAARLHVYACLV